MVILIETNGTFFSRPEPTGRDQLFQIELARLTAVLVENIAVILSRGFAKS
jgi:hypothetical protein